MMYLVQVDVKHVVGTQLFEIEAETPEAALKAVKDGGGDCIASDLEVERLDWASAEVTES